MRASSGGEELGLHPPIPPTVSIRGLKDLVIARFPEGHPLRDVILAEKDILTRGELIAKLETWLVLINRRA